mgnify:CR=1 FL=1
MTLEEERKALEEQRRTLERERREFTRRVEIEDRRLEQQQKLFNMKFKILEEELVKLATEKEHVKKQKAFYQRVSDFSVTAEQPVIRGEMFFSGVENRQSLKKRYKDLIKIYHPDNLVGIRIPFRKLTVSIISFVLCTKIKTAIRSVRRPYGCFMHV